MHAIGQARSAPQLGSAHHVTKAIRCASHIVGGYVGEHDADATVDVRYPQARTVIYVASDVAPTGADRSSA